ncbi:MAG: class I SAM-dependent methyltransferase [Haliea sp.]
MQKSISHFVRICSAHLPIKGPIYEFGSYQVTGSEDENLRSLFPDFTYIGSDMRQGPGVDLVLDMQQMDLPDQVAGCVLCLDTLEHVEYPRRAMREIHRILEPDGIVIISSVFNFPIHGYPNDYWRFTPEGFNSLLQEFSMRKVYSFGLTEPDPVCVVGVGFKGKVPALGEFDEHCSNWSKWHSAVLQAMANDSENN